MAPKKRRAKKAAPKRRRRSRRKSAKKAAPKRKELAAPKAVAALAEKMKAGGAYALFVAEIEKTWQAPSGGSASSLVQRMSIRRRLSIDATGDRNGDAVEQFLEK